MQVQLDHLLARRACSMLPARLAILREECQDKLRELGPEPGALPLSDVIKTAQEQVDLHELHADIMSQPIPAQLKYQQESFNQLLSTREENGTSPQAASSAAQRQQQLEGLAASIKTSISQWLDDSWYVDLVKQAVRSALQNPHPPAMLSRFEELLAALMARLPAALEAANIIRDVKMDLEVPFGDLHRACQQAGHELAGGFMQQEEMSARTCKRTAERVKAALENGLLNRTLPPDFCLVEARSIHDARMAISQQMHDIAVAKNILEVAGEAPRAWEMLLAGQQHGAILSTSTVTTAHVHLTGLWVLWPD